MLTQYHFMQSLGVSCTLQWLFSYWIGAE